MNYRNRMPECLHLQLLDSLSVIVSFFIAIWIRYGISFHGVYGIIYGIIFILLLLSNLCILNLFDSYRGFFRRGFFEEFISVVQTNLLVMLFLSVVLFYFKIGASYSRVFFMSFFFFNIFIDYLFRQYFKILLLAYYKKSGASNKVLLLTTAERAEAIIRTIRKEREWEFQITGIALLDRKVEGMRIAGIPIIAGPDNIFDVVTKAVIDEVFINVPYDTDLNLNELILTFENMGITVNLSIESFNLNVKEKTIKSFGGYPVLTFSTRVFEATALILKRAMDILGAIVGLILTAIISIFIVPAILIDSPGPVLFSQVRIGKNGRRFKIYKFRSMYQDAEARKKELMKQNEMQGLMFKMSNDPRITKMGRFIRKTSIDELPQFWNVLKGDMSLVGTRPPTEDEFLQYEGYHKRRLTLRPGITGLWQVSGRSGIENFDEVVKLDLEYIDGWSLVQDVRLLVKTVFVVLFRVGAK